PANGKVILLARPSAEELTDLSREDLLLRYWRRLFHCLVHLELEKRVEGGALSPADIQRRVEGVGQTKIAAYSTGHNQENYLLPGADDRAVYLEFVAVYLDLSFFLPNVPAVYFPALRGPEKGSDPLQTGGQTPFPDLSKIDRLLAQDVDGQDLFARTRLPGAPAPLARADTFSDEPDDAYHRLLHAAERAAHSGNTVRAAVYHIQAAAVAPSALTARARMEARADLGKLAARLQPALKLGDEQT